jgi:predicted flap endonuclease-1-like 5' DNA nuclease
MANLSDIEGIGPAYAAKLGDAGLQTTDDLLSAGGTHAGREQLAESTGISHSLLLEWVNHADLYRIRGVGSEYADLLEAAGVDTVVELAQRNPANLAAALASANEERKLVRTVPSETQVAEWIEQAKGLDRAVEH